MSATENIKPFDLYQAMYELHSIASLARGAQSLIKDCTQCSEELDAANRVLGTLLRDLGETINRIDELSLAGFQRQGEEVCNVQH